MMNTPLRGVLFFKSEFSNFLSSTRETQAKSVPFVDNTAKLYFKNSSFVFQFLFNFKKKI